MGDPYLAFSLKDLGRTVEKAFIRPQLHEWAAELGLRAPSGATPTAPTTAAMAPGALGGGGFDLTTLALIGGIGLVGFMVVRNMGRGRRR